MEIVLNISLTAGGASVAIHGGRPNGGPAGAWDTGCFAAMNTAACAGVKRYARATLSARFYDRAESVHWRTLRQQEPVEMQIKPQMPSKRKCSLCSLKSCLNQGRSTCVGRAGSSKRGTRI